MKNKYLIPTIFLGLLTFLAAGAGADEFKLDSPDNIALHNVTVQRPPITVVQLLRLN